MSVLEALARALFDAGRYGEAVEGFRALVSRTPNDDYAHFGLGLALARQGFVHRAVEHFALAAAMRPDRAEYVRALRESRATLRARETGS
jgi:Flp pilus assembly protein TadD